MKLDSEIWLESLPPEVRVEIEAELDAVSKGMREALEIAFGLRQREVTESTSSPQIERRGELETEPENLP